MILSSSVTAIKRSFSMARSCRGQYLVIAHDAPGKDVLAQRLATRPAHLDGIQTLSASGKFVIGGAMLSEETGKPVGSCVLLQAGSIEEARQIVADDPYTQAGVWDKVTVVPFKTAVMCPENLKQ